MNIVQEHKYKKDGIVYVGGNVPDGAEIIETLNILVADKGKELHRKSDDKKIGTSIWLRDGDSQENYVEVEIKDDNND